MADYFRWYPADGSNPIVFSGEEPYILRAHTGTGGNFANEQSQKAPFQIGQSFLNVDISPRIINLNLRIVARVEDIDLYREELSEKMAIEPNRDEVPSIGTLRYLGGARGVDVEIEAIPINSPQFTHITFKNIAVDADLEFFCPYPYWKETSDNFFELERTGGEEFPLEFPIEIESVNIEQEVINEGDVAAPIMARVYGELTTFRLINVTTGETLEVTGSLASDEYVEIHTEFGNKNIVLVNTTTGTETSIMDRLNLDNADFFKLQKGVNLIRFEADTNISGKAAIWWRQRYIGI